MALVISQTEPLYDGMSTELRGEVASVVEDTNALIQLTPASNPNRSLRVVLEIFLGDKQMRSRLAKQQYGAACYILEIVGAAIYAIERQAKSFNMGVTPFPSLGGLGSASLRTQALLQKYCRGPGGLAGKNEAIRTGGALLMNLGPGMLRQPLAAQLAEGARLEADVDLGLVTELSYGVLDVRLAVIEPLARQALISSVAAIDVLAGRPLTCSQCRSADPVPSLIGASILFTFLLLPEAATAEGLRRLATVQ